MDKVYCLNLLKTDLELDHWYSVKAELNIWKKHDKHEDLLKTAEK